MIRRQWTVGRQRSRIAELERQLAEQQQRSRDLDAELLAAYRKLRSTKTDKTKRESLARIDSLLDERNQIK
jgi:uncharacterized coiled-coil protein SlyX